jgi:hypothetical protein
MSFFLHDLYQIPAAAFYVKGPCQYTEYLYLLTGMKSRHVSIFHEKRARTVCEQSVGLSAQTADGFLHLHRPLSVF